MNQAALRLELGEDADFHQVIFFPTMYGSRRQANAMAKGLRSAPSMGKDLDELRTHLIQGYELAAKTPDRHLLNALLQSLFLWGNSVYQGRRVCRIDLY